MEESPYRFFPIEKVAIAFSPIEKSTEMSRYRFLSLSKKVDINFFPNQKSRYIFFLSKRVYIKSMLYFSHRLFSYRKNVDINYFSYRKKTDNDYFFLIKKSISTILFIEKCRYRIISYRKSRYRIFSYRKKSVSNFFLSK